VTEENEFIYCPYIEVKQPIGCFYVTSLSFQELSAIAYADIRKVDSDFDNYLGIQRSVSPGRRKEIAEYVNTLDATFPTSIILAIDTKKDGELTHNIEIEGGRLKIKKDEKVASILDGQHRLAGMREAVKQLNSNLDDFHLNVTIFIDADKETQAQIFSVINKAQTKVNKSLVYDLYEYAKKRSPFKTAHNVVRVLNRNERSPFFKKIKLLGKVEARDINEERTESISQAIFVDMILLYISKNPVEDRDSIMRGDKLKKDDSLLFRDSFINEKDENITRILYCFFDAVKNKWPISWETIGGGNILNKTTGFIALMKFLKNVTDCANDFNELLEKEYYTKIFDKISMPDGEFTSGRYPSGKTGQDNLYKAFLDAMFQKK